MITLTQTSGSKRRINRAPSGKEYIMEGFLEPGLVSYDDVGAGVARLNKEAIDKMLPSFIGCPVTIDHVNESKDDVLNGKAVDEHGQSKKKGEVTKAWWNAETGRYDCSFTVEDSEADDLVKNGEYSGSCAYNVTSTGPGGELHAMSYDEEITDGAFEHLALVTNPRYEDCKIRVNSKPAKIKGNDMKENGKMLCVECGASFSHKNPTVETRCPKCHGYDVEVANAKENAGFRNGDKVYTDMGSSGIIVGYEPGTGNGEGGKFVVETDGGKTIKVSGMHLKSKITHRDDNSVTLKNGIQRGDSVHIITSAAGVPQGTAGVVMRVAGTTLTVRTVKGDATVREGEVELIKESREFENSAGSYDVGDQFLAQTQGFVRKGARGTVKGYEVKYIEENEWSKDGVEWWVEVLIKKQNAITLKSNGHIVLKTAKQEG